MMLAFYIKCFIYSLIIYKPYGLLVSMVSVIVIVLTLGHQSAIINTMTIEEIYQNRKEFSLSVFEAASTDLKNLGIVVVAYTLKDVFDNHG